MQGVMIKADNTARSSTKEKVREGKRHRRTKQPRDIEIKLEEVSEQKQAEQQTQREEMEDQLRQTKDQNKDLYGTNQRGWGRFQRHVIFFQNVGPQCDKKCFNMYAKVASPVQ